MKLTSEIREIELIREPWSGTMTGRERFVRQLRGASVDRSFNMEFGYWDDNFSRWPIFRENGILNNASADRFFGFDRIDVVGTPWMLPVFPCGEIERRERTRLIRNADGLLAETPIDDHGTIPRFHEASVRGPEDWATVKQERFDRTHTARIPNVERLKQLHPTGRDYPLGVNCGSMIGKIRDMLTVEGLIFAIHDYPEMVEDMVETSCLLIEDFLDRVLPEIDFDFAAGWEDICCNTGPLVPLRFFRDVVVPRYQRIHDRLEAHGIEHWWIDCDGDVRPLLSQFLRGGVDVMFPWEVNGSGHPAEALARWPELKIMGGFNKMVLLRGRSAIDAYFESLIPSIEAGRFIPFCDHRCPPDVDPDDYLYYLDRKRRLLEFRPLPGKR